MEQKSVSFEQLVVWRKAHDLVLKVYQITSGFPKHEIFGLTSQFRRAVVSIAANIAESYAKKTKPDKIKFFNISQGSLEECRYYILLSKDLHYIPTNDYDNMNIIASEISKLLTSYLAKIQIEYSKK
jgi:four helix bundle protein